MKTPSSEIVPVIDFSTLEIDYTKKLGFGAFSEVFQGRMGLSPVAIKKLKISETELNKEAMIHYPLRHKNIVLMYGISFSPGQYLIIMAKISISLEDLLHSDAPLSHEQIYTIDQGFVEGVSYLHRNGIIHRDLRSANILIDVDHHCHPYISDFGLSEIKAEDDNPRARTSKGSRVIIGSPAWMAPELFKNWPCSKQSDFYSIGVILWETITRRYPFEGIDRQEIIKKVWKGEREKIPNNVPKHYAKLIQQCWQQAPEQRPKDAIYIARALRLFKLHLAKETEQGQEQGQFLSQKL